MSKAQPPARLNLSDEARESWNKAIRARRKFEKMKNKEDRERNKLQSPSERAIERYKRVWEN